MKTDEGSVLMKISSRLNYIDVMKGLGILLVILGHCISSTDNFVNKFILSFHMPLFFFASGYLYSRKSNDREYFSGKVKGLIVPVLLYQIINIITKLVFSQISERLSDLIMLRGFWFIFALFYISIMYYVIEGMLKLKIKDENSYKIDFFMGCISIFFVIIGCIYGKIFVNTTSYVNQACVGYIFFWIGHLIRNRIELKCQKFINNRWILLISGFVLFAVTGIVSQFNSSVLMYLNSYGNVVFFIICSMLGVFALFFVSRAIADNAVLEFFGKNSLVILVTHFCVYRLFGFCVRHILRGGAEWIHIIIVFLLTAVAEWVIVVVVNKFFPFFAGKFNYEN